MLFPVLAGRQLDTAPVLGMDTAFGALHFYVGIAQGAGARVVDVGTMAAQVRQRFLVGRLVFLLGGMVIAPLLQAAGQERAGKQHHEQDSAPFNSRHTAGGHRLPAKKKPEARSPASHAAARY